MSIVVTVRYDANTRAPRQGGDLTSAIYDVTVATGPNAYPAGGEPIDFSAQFAEVHAAIPTTAFNSAGTGNPDVDGAMVPAFERDTDNTGRIRFFQGPNPNANLPELSAGAYPNAMQFSILAVGRPITDSF